MSDDDDTVRRALARIEELTREKTMLVEQHDMWKAQWREAADEVTRLQRDLSLTRSLVQVNLFHNKQLDDIGELLADYDDVAPDIDAPPVVTLSIRKLRDILQRERPKHIGPADPMRVCFNWRDQTRPDGYSDALPGDGFGFCQFVENETRTGLMMQFECAGITACVDMPVDMLRETAAKAGYVLLRMSESALSLVGFADANASAVTMAQQRRITELERDLKSTEADNERLMARVYGAGDERDHVQIAVDRVEDMTTNNERETMTDIRVGDTFKVVPTVKLVKTVEDDAPRALEVFLPLPGQPGHHGAVHEMLQAFKVFGVELPTQEG